MLFRESVRLVYPGASVSRSMTMVDDGANIAVYVRIEMLPALAMINAALDDMKCMRNYTGRDKHLALGVIIDTPGVAEAVSNHLKTILYRMIPPYPPVYVDALSFENVFRKGIAMFVDLLSGIRFVNPGRGGKPLKTIEPAVRSPMKAVERLVAIPDAPTRKKNFDVVQVGHIVSIAIRNEQEVGRRTKKHAVESNRERRRKRYTFHKHTAAISHTIPIRVLQNENTAVPEVREPGPAVFIVTIFGDP